MMQRTLSLLSLLVLSTTLCTSASAQPTHGSLPATHLAQAQSVDAITTYTQEITVRIRTNNNQGSGTLISKQNNTYLVLTNQHILQGAKTIQIQTYDGQTHTATLVQNSFSSGYDLALVSFEGNQSYTLPELGNFTPRPGQSLASAGYAADSQQFQISTHPLQQILDQPLKGGYQLGCPGDVKQGMSGGPIIETTTGELVGINGQSVSPVVDNYETVDGTSLNPETIQQLRQLNWGISLQTVLAQIQPNILTAYGLPQPLVASTVKMARSQGWVADLEAKAKNISVRIDSSSGSNGSGVIIARQGQTYTVLTANHVVCETANGSPPCLAQRYSVVTPDGQTHPINANTIRRQEGVDLAIFKFQSEANFEIAAFGDYNPKTDDEVFVAGFPKVNQSEASWQFNGGKVFDKNRGFLEVASYRMQQADNVISIPQASFWGGYELVYSSITYGGMSGGVVLDRQGQVIGIHGLAEGESETGNINIQLGWSLGIPTSSVLGVMPKFNVDLNALQINTTAPATLSSLQQEEWQASVLKAQVPTSNAKPEVWIERGNQLWRLEQHAEALAAFEQAIQFNPEFVHLAWYGKALVYRAQEDYSAAETALQKVVQLKPTYKPSWQLLSVVYRNLKQPKQALVAIEKGLQIKANDAQLLNEKYTVLGRLRRYPEALATIDAAIAQAPRAAFYINRGVVLMWMDQFEASLATVNQALELDPRLAIAYTNRGVIHQLLRRYDAALADHQQAIQLDPQDSYVYSGLGQLYLAERRFEQALAQFKKGISIDPENTTHYSGQGHVYFGLKRYEDAIAAHTQAIQLEPNLPSHLSSRANIYLLRQQYENAIADWSKAIELDPQNPTYFQGRGEAYAGLNQPKAAIADFSQAIQLAPRDVQSYTGRGQAYQSLQQYEAAIANFNQAIKNADYPQATAVDNQYIQQKKGFAYTARGYLHVELEKFEQAIADFTQAIELRSNSDNPNGIPLAKTDNLHNIRAISYINLKQYDKALADYTKAIEIAPQNPKYRVSRGQLYQKMGREAEATADFQTALKTEPKDSEGYRVRAGINKSLKRYSEAISDYSKAIELAPQNGLRTSILYSSRARVHSELQQYEQAKTDFSQAIVLHPNPRSPYVSELFEARGRNFLNWQRLEGAVGDFSKAIEINSKNILAYAGRGPIYLETKRYEQALSDFNTIIELNPQASPAYDLRSQTHRRLQRFEEAISDASKYIELNPKQPVAYTKRGILYALTNNAQHALKDFKQAVELDEKAIIPTINMGLIYYEQEERNLAIAQFKRAMELDDKLAEPQLALAIALYHSGQQQQAIASAKFALTKDSRLRDVEFLKQNLWGDQLIADAQQLFSDPAL
ncbi:tetratricopeptide repeat protein [Acaryochloris marina]|uniref:tetratricopeptide repeat protein n=1 Tax=Acaryochloris marina TaxID=155978 RepID=UPI0021C3755B|nr:tetratricopeptide repeat protein [Acaryochloris marina]BDM79938.1 hypothetical protein AM10699_28060 [Acaryochloris marina MBIC10699]